MTGFDLPSFLRRLPKAELHCHVVGTLRPATLAALARKHGLPLPRPEAELYRYRGFYDFIDVFRLASRVLVDADDFARVAYEYLTDARRTCNLRYAELFFNPSYHYPHGVRYRTQLEGLLSGMRDAERDAGVSARLIPSIDREFGTALANQVIDDVLANRVDEVVGIGLDGPEDKGPPELFAEPFTRAGRAGLKRTAHVGEDYAPTPPSNYAACRDRLGCERFDHGYRLLGDPAVVARARDDGFAFTCCPKPSTRERDAIRLGAIGGLADAGVRITLATDDPLMFDTDLNDAYRRACEGLGWDAERAVALALAAVEAAWLDAAEKAALRKVFAGEIEVARQSMGPAAN